MLVELYFSGGFCQISNAQTNGSQHLDPYNAARAMVGVAALSWSANLADYALDYENSQRNQCLPLKHSNGQFEENLFWGSAKDPEWTPLDAATDWTEEVAGVLQLRREFVHPGADVRALNAGGVEFQQRRGLRSRQVQRRV